LTLPDSTPIASLNLEPRLIVLLAKPSTVNLLGGHKVTKPAWNTLGDLRNRRIGQKHPADPESERCRGRLCFIAGLAVKDESSIVDIIGSDLPEIT